ncbi:MAG: polysaccharide biosynthesis C-terminal domain-containing protein, partial [Monoglobaceae bacterium]
STLRIAMLFAAPCAFGMAVLSKEILNLLFGTYDAASVLSIISFAIIPVAIVQVTNSILQAYGRVYVPVVNMIVGGAVKVLVNFLCIPYLGIDGAPVGTGVCYLIIAILNIRAIIKTSGVKINWIDFIARPLVAALIMSAVGYILSTFIPVGRFMCIVEIGICVVAYAVAVLFIVKALRREDVLTLPKGDKIANILDKFKVLR